MLLSCRAYFYPRPPRGGRLIISTNPPGLSKFLSTPSARRATWQSRSCLTSSSHFYPRPPRGGRLPTACGAHGRTTISIHALREEGDPCVSVTVELPTIFLSTPSARRATGSTAAHFDREYLISIHALREEGDSKNGEKHLRFCFIIKRSAQIWKSLSKNIRKKSRDLHRMP